MSKSNNEVPQKMVEEKEEEIGKKKGKKNDNMFQSFTQKADAVLQERNIKNIDPEDAKDDKEKFRRPKGLSKASRGQLLLNDIIKQKPLTFESVYDSFSKTYPEILKTKEDAIFYFKLSKAFIINSKISISDILSYKKFEVIVSDFGEYKTNSAKVFTNDKLYWLSVIDNTLNNNFKDMKTFIEFSDPKVYVCTRLEPLTDEYESYYVRDYTGNFSFIGYELFSEEEIDKIKEGEYAVYFKNSRKFEFGGGKYVCLTTDTYSNATIVSSDYDNENDVTNNIKNILKNVTIYDTKKKLTKNTPKIHTLKGKVTAKNIYISQTFDLIDFCPSELVFESPMFYEYYAKFQVDILKLEKYLYEKASIASEKLKKVTDYINIPGLINWDTFDLFINFVFVESMTKLIAKPEDKTKFSELTESINTFVTDYHEVKPYITYVKTDISKILIFFIRFYQSFQTRVNYDTLTRLSNTYDKIKQDFDTLKEKGFVKNVLDFIVNNGLEDMACQIHNVLKDNMEIINTIMSEMDIFFTKFKQMNYTFITDLKSIGKKIYSMFRSNYKDNMYVYNYFISPAVFFGGLLEGNNFLADKIEDKMIKKEEEAQKEENEIMALVEVLENKDKKTKAFEIMITKYIFSKTGDTRFIDDKNWTFKPSLQDWFKGVYEGTDGLFKNKKTLDKLKGYASALFARYNSKRSAYMFNREEYIEPLNVIFNSFKTYIDKKQLAKDMALIILDARVNELINRANQLKKEPLPPFYGEVDVDRMKKMEIPVIDVESELIPEDIRTFVKDARKKGVTDDVSLEFLQKEYTVDELKDIPEKHEKPKEEKIDELAKATQNLWGPAGSKYIDKLTKITSDASKEMPEDIKPKKKPQKKTMNLTSINKKRKRGKKVGGSKSEDTKASNEEKEQ